MAKKTSSVSFLYGIGMILAAVGFCLPIFHRNFFGSRAINGFGLVGDGTTAIKIFTLLIFVGAVIGVLVTFISVPQAKLLKICALALSVVSFIVVVVLLSRTKAAAATKFFGAQDFALKQIFKSLYVGAYMIFAGWIVAAAGLAMNK